MLALRIALRYLAAPKSHRAVNVISAIAVAGVAVATAAIVVVLSVFNGFSELSRRHLSFVDPDLSISAATGKTVDASAVARVLDARNDVAAHTPVLVERGLMVTANGQMPVVAVGIDDDSYRRVAATDSIVLDGIFTTGELMPDMPPAAVASVGVAMQTGIRPSPESTFDIYFPRRRGRINPANPSGAYVNGALTLAGVFRVDQPEYDTDRLYIPLAVMRTLLERDSSAATPVDVRLHSGADVAATADEVSKALGSDYVVTERERLHPETFRMIAVEKWITFLMLVFILLIASFNIVTTISLLVIEKRDNMATLRALGTPRHTIAAVFAWDGALITTAGGMAGLAVGVLLAWLQQHFGLIKLAADPSQLTISVYPVKIETADVALTAAAVVLLGIGIGQISRLFTRKIA